MTNGRVKCAVKPEERDNTRVIQFCGSFDHVTLMTVISAVCQVMTPLVVLPGVENKCRKRPSGTYEPPFDFLLSATISISVQWQELIAIFSIIGQKDLLRKRRHCEATEKN